MLEKLLDKLVVPVLIVGGLSLIGSALYSKGRADAIRDLNMNGLTVVDNDGREWTLYNE